MFSFMEIMLFIFIYFSLIVDIFFLPFLKYFWLGMEIIKKKRKKKVVDNISGGCVFA